MIPRIGVPLVKQVISAAARSLQLHGSGPAAAQSPTTRCVRNPHPSGCRLLTRKGAKKPKPKTCDACVEGYYRHLI